MEGIINRPPALYPIPDLGEYRVHQLIDAAWHFSCACLWPEQPFSRDEEDAAKDYLKSYFGATWDKRSAFIALIQRVVLMRSYHNHMPGQPLPEPSVWFNLSYPFGFAGTFPWYCGVEQRRRKTPAYLLHLRKLALGYYRYALKPTEERYLRCRSKLEAHHAMSLVLLLNAAINRKHANRVKL